MGNKTLQQYLVLEKYGGSGEGEFKMENCVFF